MALPLAAPTFVIYPEQTIYQAAADKLGNLQATLAPLKNEEAAVKEILRSCPDEVVEGRLFRCTISPGKAGQKIDWEALARSVLSKGQIEKLVPDFTTVTDAPAARIAVKARKGV
jgi:hypothetical protein